MTSIFSLNVVRYSYSHRYLEYKVYEESWGYADSLEGAEKLMHQVIKAHDYDLFCFYIREEPVNRLRCEKFENVYGELSERVYDANGKLLDSRGVCYEFNGREPDAIRFKPGDLVEVYNGNGKVYLGFVMEVPSSKESVDNIRGSNRSKENKGCGLDYSDDQYMIKTNDTFDHAHINSLYVFKPHFKIPKPTYERLKRQYRNYIKNYVKEWFHHPPLEWEEDWMRNHGMDKDGNIFI